MQPRSAPSPARIALLIGLLCLAWGASWLVIKIGLEDVPPFTGAALRFAIAGAAMALAARLWSGREGGDRPPRAVVLSHGVCQFGLNYGLVYMSETVIPSGMVAVLWAVFPLFIALGEHVVLRTQRLSALKWLGIATSFAGVATLFATDLRAVDARAVPMGLLLMLAPSSVAASTLFIKQRASGASSLLLNRDGMLIGALLLGACSLVLESPLEVKWTARALWSLAYLSIVASVMTFGIYFWLLRYVPAYRMSLISFITPVVALTFGALLGAEPIGPRTLLGAGLVLCGVALAMRRS